LYFGLASIIVLGNVVHFDFDFGVYDIGEKE